MAHVLDWFKLMFLSGLGAAVLMVYDFLSEPGCTRRCYLDTLSDLQASMGDSGLAALLFVFGWLGFFWYSLRA